MMDLLYGDRMPPVSLAVVLAALAVFSLATVAALVRFSRAVLQRDARERTRWGWIYAASWLAVLATIALFLGDDLRRNAMIVLAIPAAILIMHALLLRFAIAIRDANERDRAQPRRDPSRFAPPEEEEEEEEEELPPPPPPTTAERIRIAFRNAIRWIVSVAIALVLIAVGENLRVLHQLDAALAPHRVVVGRVLAILTAAGFALFMAGAIRFALTKEQPRYLIPGALTMIAGGMALAIVLTPPGVKLIVIIAAVYALTRAALGRRSPAVPR